MPNRIVREGYLDSERVNALDPPSERFYFRLFLVVDDYGRYESRPELLKSKCFPVREDVRIADIPRWMAACQKAGLLVEYTVNGRRYLELLDFRQRVRADKSKYPGRLQESLSNDGQMTVISQSSARLDVDVFECEDVDECVDADTACGEPLRDSPPESPVVLVFPCVGKGRHEWLLTQEKVDEYKASFPGVDVLAECKKALQWERDNPTKRKTFNGHPAFLGRWLGNQQNKSGGGYEKRGAGIRHMRKEDFDERGDRKSEVPI